MPSHDLRSPAASDARAGLVPGASAPVEPRAAAPPGATSQHDPRVGGYDVDPRAASFAAPVSVPVGEQTPWGLASRVTARERAVLAFFRGDESPRGIAARFGLTLDELFDWIHVYREAGRSALAR
ncbi:MAG: helix-turn-helix domain-containing protein [Nannocystaceae bacterium]